MKPARPSVARKTVPLAQLRRTSEICLEVADNSIIRRSAVNFFNVQGTRDPHGQAARLADQFVRQNRALTALLDVRIERDYDGNDMRLVIESGNAAGAVPLLSPTTARPDFGLVVQPRFPWRGSARCSLIWAGVLFRTHSDYLCCVRSERRVPYGCSHR